MQIPRRTKTAFGAAALLLFVACGARGPHVSQPTSPAMDTLVSTEWLSQHLHDPDLVVLDCTVRVERGEDGGMRVLDARSDYESGHIPTAGFADLTGELSASDSQLSFALPSPDEFAAAMGALGVGDDSRVVLYSANNPAWAARVWWMLRWVGFDHAALLDGGLQAWKSEGRALSNEPVERPAQQLTVALRPTIVADQDEVRAAIDRGDATLIDALPEAVYEGKMPMYGRPGHIAGAVNIPATSLTDGSGHYLPLERLAELHTGTHDARAITYCGGGIAASSNAFVMTRLGFTDVAVYMASLQEWAADPTNPMEVGAP